MSFTVSEKKRPPSLKEFDYFDESREPVGWEGGPAHAAVSLEGQLASYRARQRRYSRGVMLMTFTFAVCLWFMWGFRDEIRYAFSAPQPPREMGPVTTFTPGDLQANTYVKVSGITEPFRGLSQQRARGLSLGRQEYWFFRLAGSGGVFIETPADKDKYGYAMNVEVAGRVVDPAEDPEYAKLLEQYHQRYFAKRRTVSRIIQVGMAPGEGKGPYMVAFGILLVLVISNGFALLRMIQYRRLASGKG